MQFRRSHIHFSKLNAIFITHMHGDHCFGLMGLLSTLGMLGRTSKLRVYAPKDYAPLFKQQVEFFMQTMEYEMEMIPVDTEKQQIIYEDHSLSVETVPLKHRLPCCGYIFREKPTLPHIKRDMIDYYGIPISQINNIKNGADWTNEEGEVIPNARLVTPADTPRPTPALRHFVAELGKLLDENDVRTGPLWREQGHQLAALVGPGAAQIGQAIELFEFEEAAALLSGIVATHPELGEQDEAAPPGA